MKTIEIEQPRLFVYVMFVVPLERALTSPVFEIVATPVLLDVHGLVVAGEPDPFNWLVVPTHKVVFPDIVGFALTVTFWVTEHPTLFVYVITPDPAATPVTNPELVTVAVAVLELTHGLVVAAVTLPVN